MQCGLKVEQFLNKAIRNINQQRSCNTCVYGKLSDCNCSRSRRRSHDCEWEAAQDNFRLSFARNAMKFHQQKNQQHETHRTSAGYCTTEPLVSRFKWVVGWWVAGCLLSLANWELWVCKSKLSLMSQGFHISFMRFTPQRRLNYY